MILQHGLKRSQNWLRCRGLVKLTNALQNSRSLSNSPIRFSSRADEASDVTKIRNIGIIAHIDAGKTTTTERMLYYSGHIRRLGDVDDGSTVTDFLPAERARGITIQSAAITFKWPPPGNGTGHTTPELPRSARTHQINLIDTPGHADFTFEVRRSLRILDGAVCILDGVAGVEAQTEQVWKQAGEWKIPRIAYINKLDRDGAAFGKTVREIGLKLGVWPVLCQIPWWEGGKGRFCGIVDVVNLQALRYEQGGDGKNVQHFSLTRLREVEPGLADELQRARIALIELLSEEDHELIETFFDVGEDHLAVPPQAIIETLRRNLMMVDCKIVPVFAGASFRNIGVQPLLDAINDLLPGPAERPPAEISIGSLHGNMDDLSSGGLVESALRNVHTTSRNPGMVHHSKSGLGMLKGCALAFKVVNDPRKGMLVYIRVYSGSIDRNSLLYNTNLCVSERATTLLRMYADVSVPVQSIEAGQIGVIAGSRHARTGDTLIAYNSNKPIPPEPLDKLQLRPITVPPPVFFASLEPNSLREEKEMHDKLAILLREDPSLHVTQDEDTGQTLLSGMGELHLEIARDRLVNDLKANVHMGKIAIGYRQTFTKASSLMHRVFDRDRADTKGKAGCTAIVEPLDSHQSPSSPELNNVEREQDGNVISVQAPSLDRKGRPLSSDDIGLPDHLVFRDVQDALSNGALAALSKGPTYSYPIRGMRVTLTFQPSSHTFGSETSYAALTAAARLATIAAFRDAAAKGGSALMEPVMDVEISVDDANLGNVIQDISSSRGGHIVSLSEDDDEQEVMSSGNRNLVDVSHIYAPKDPFEFSTTTSSFRQVNLQRSVKAKVPLKEMVGYLKHLRSMTGGRGTFVMNVDRFVKMSIQREKALLADLQGL